MSTLPFIFLSSDAILTNEPTIRSLEFDAPVKQVFRYKNDDIERDELYLLFVTGNVDKVTD